MSEELRKRIGLVGVGLMGHGLGQNVLKHGFPLTVLGRRNRTFLDDLLSRGASEVTTARELADRTDVVLICVNGAPEVKAVVYGDVGLLAGARRDLVVVDCSTSDPQLTVKVAADFAARGCMFLDSPMTGSPLDAQAGRLGLMVGGDAKLIDELRPILSSFAATIVRAGAVGAGHTLQLINVFLALGSCAVVAEAMSAAAKAGVDFEALNAVIPAGAGNSVMFQRLIKLVLNDDDTASKFAIANAKHDLRLYTNLTETLPVVSFIGEAIHQTYVLADSMGYGDRFVTRLVDFFGELNGVKVRKS